MPHEALVRLLSNAPLALRPLDVAFAHFLADQARDDDNRIPLLGAIISQQASEGHLCLQRATLQVLAQAESAWPESWRELLFTPALDDALARSPVVDIAPEVNGAPLVLDGDRFYLRRYWDHERFVAAAIKTRLGEEVTLPDELGVELRRLFPGSQSPSWARIAGALAARHRFTVITGGPGTGKTTTVVRLLGLLQTLQHRNDERPLRIRLAAPTGKAAARLQGSIRAQVATLDVNPSIRAIIPVDVMTLHRLLGARPQTRRFVYNDNNWLHLDVLVIDEASMIDLELMSAALAALPEHARLILLGDKDQLSSVEAGAVLGDICQRAEAGCYDRDTMAWVRSVTGDDLMPWQCSDASALDQCIVMLRESHRFKSDSGIGQLAAAINRGDAAASIALLRSNAPDLDWQTQGDALRAWVLDPEQGYRYYLDTLHRERPPSHAGQRAIDDWAIHVLQAYERFQLLCALRHGPFGATGLNEQVEAWLRKAELIHPVGEWYEGRPVIMTRNDYPLGLMNGDIGITLRVPQADGTSSLRVAFVVADDASDHRIRLVPPARLGALDTAFALTVHKSQGSEFDHVALVLPDKPGALTTRELLYTAVTRARRRFNLSAPEQVINTAVTRRIRRDSMLSARLRRSNG